MAELLTEEGAERAGLAAFLRERREAVLQAWEASVRTEPAARALSRAALREPIPELLERVADCLDAQACGGTGAAVVPLSRVHALVRLGQGYDVEALTREYAVLRVTVHRLYAEHLAGAGLDAGGVVRLVRELGELSAVLDASLAASVAQFGRARARTLEALDRLTALGLEQRAGRDGAAGLVPLLPRLLALLRESVEAVDTAVLLLREGDWLEVRATAGLEEASGAGFRVRVGEGFAGAVAATGEPQELRDPGRDPRALAPALRTAGLRVVYGVPLRDAAGQVLGVVHVGSRSTEHFSAEDTLLVRTLATRAAGLLAEARAATAFAQVDALLEALPAGVALFDADLRYVRANRTLAEANGLPAEAHLGRTVRDVVPERAKVAEPLLRQVLRTGAPVRGLTFEGPAAHAPDAPRHWSADYFPVRAPDGTGTGTGSGPGTGPVVGVGAVVTDVTERVHTERALRQALAESRRAMDVLEHGDAVFVVDRDWRLLLVNQQQERLTGLPREAQLGRDFWEVFPRSANPAGPQWRLFHHAMQTREQVELEVYSSSLGRWVAMRVYPTLEGGLAAFFHDISKRKRAEEVQERLVGIVGHDLRNPLHAIRLTTTMLLEREGTPPPVLAGVRRIAKSADRMGRMIAELLDFTRARVGGGIPLQPVPCVLEEVARGVVEEFAVTHPGRVALRASTRTPGVWDPERLAQVVGNLVGNALQHGAPDAEVEVEVRREGDTAVLAVHNAGNPIPPELLPRIFDPFRGVEGGGGLGLGLYIVEHLVRAHGGQVEVRSVPEADTTFTVRLPLAAPAPGPTPASAG